jgi:hypothetical protein
MSEGANKRRGDLVDSKREPGTLSRAASPGDHSPFRKK